MNLYGMKYKKYYTCSNVHTFFFIKDIVKFQLLTFLLFVSYFLIVKYQKMTSFLLWLVSYKLNCVYIYILPIYSQYFSIYNVACMERRRNSKDSKKGQFQVPEFSISLAHLRLCTSKRDLHMSFSPSTESALYLASSAGSPLE